MKHRAIARRTRRRGIALHARARIETLDMKDADGYPISPSTRGRGLKLNHPFGHRAVGRIALHARARIE
ncbi:MAG TPA: hypothetical protein PLS55_15190, partial [Thermogutta sp.]|nr:hypothetical protein [Thermogutta sp.]